MSEKINNQEQPIDSYDIETDNYENFKKSMSEFLDLDVLDNRKIILFEFPYNLKPFAERFISDIPDISVYIQESENSVTYDFTYIKLHSLTNRTIKRRLTFLISQDISEMVITVYY